MSNLVDGSITGPTDPIARLRDATRNTPYAGRLYLVGGLLRDRALGLPLSADLDLVLEGDAVELAQFLYSRGISHHYPVLYPRFGTAMIRIDGPNDDGTAVELVSARAESYQPDSRKPEVRKGTLREDVFRRDFTINTLIQNLHTGEELDLTGQARADLVAGIIRTPVEPEITFFDDPLRMLRAIRFAARFEFEIEAATWDAICKESTRLRPPAIANERIREEFIKIAALPGPRFRRGLDLLRQSHLLDEFLAEMLPMIGCSQGDWHRWDVWDHTLEALEALPDNATLVERLGLLWHDVGKPSTRIIAEDGVSIRFFGHPKVGADITRAMMNRLRFANEDIRDVTKLVDRHMRLGEYRPNWTDAAVKRLIRDCGTYLDSLFLLVRCDMAGLQIPEGCGVDMQALRSKIDALNAISLVTSIESPLDGNEIVAIAEVKSGPWVREAKEMLVNAVIDGTIAEHDKSAAETALRDWLQRSILDMDRVSFGSR